MQRFTSIATMIFNDLLHELAYSQVILIYYLMETAFAELCFFLTLAEYE